MREVQLACVGADGRRGCVRAVAPCCFGGVATSLHCTAQASGQTSQPKFSSVVRAQIWKSCHATSAIVGSNAIPAEASRGQRMTRRNEQRRRDARRHPRQHRM